MRFTVMKTILEYLDVDLPDENPATFCIEDGFTGDYTTMSVAKRGLD